MRLLTMLAGIVIALATIVGASAMQFSYSSISSAPFAQDGYTSISVTEQGVGHYGVSMTPDGISGGYSVQGSSGGFGYDYDGGLRSAAISSPDFRGSWSRGVDGPNYGSVVAGSAHFSGSMYSVNGFGNAYGSQAAYYSPYSAQWGYGSNYHSRY